MAKKKYLVKHPKLFLSVKGKLTKMEVGTELNLDAEQAEKLGDKVALKTASKSVEVGEKKETTETK